jgi:transcriptional regulator of acetoin/glycerol metabolism
LERAIAFTRGHFIRRELLEQVLSEAEESLARVRKRRGWQEREALIEALEQTGGNISQAAASLGRSRGSVYHLLKKHGISLS